jgi:hypothetical protein
MDPLDVGSHLEGPDEPGVQTRTETTGAGGGGEEIDLVRGEPRLIETGADRLASQLQAPLAESGVQLIHGLMRGKGGSIEAEVSLADLAIEEESSTEGILIPGHVENL